MRRGVVLKICLVIIEDVGGRNILCIRCVVFEELLHIIRADL